MDEAMTTREELQTCIDVLKENGEFYIANIVSTLDAEIAALKKRCKYGLDPGAQVTNWDAYEALREEYDALKSRIEGAQKVWLWWVKDLDGAEILKSASVDRKHWEARTMNHFDRIEEVHAVPVSEVER